MTMEKTAYDEVFVAVPTGVEYHQRMESIRSILSLVEAERDNALSLLREVIEVDDADDLEDVLVKVKEFVENVPFADTY